ncbi:MAG: hypothetical protein C0475_07045 [Planctomyces sp.]|nr:hypothetical protein [Planctomyces sp.]MBA4039334.1 hypothetical protein [Planctomyces sp.]
MLPFLPPFRSLKDPTRVWAWGMYDLANQSFQLLINTLLFSSYVAEVIAPDRRTGETWWTAMSAAGLLLVALVSPPMGALADARGARARFLLGTGLLASVLVMSMAALGPGHLWAAAGLYTAAWLLVGLGENFLGSFLPELADERSMGRVSAIGWGMSYVGALLLIALSYGLIAGLGWRAPGQWRWIFLIAGVWFLLGIVPALVVLRDRPRGPGGPGGVGWGGGAAGSVGLWGLVRDSFIRLAGSAKRAGKSSVLGWFLAAFFIYSMATWAYIYNLGLMSRSFGNSMESTLVFALVVAATSGVGALLAGAFQDRLGHRRMITVFLGVWIVATAGFLVVALGLVSVAPAAGSGGGSGAGSGSGWVLWGVAVLVGLGLGGLGTASRAMVGLLAPGDRCAEVFGLWGFAHKLSGVAGLIVYRGMERAAGPAAAYAVLAGCLGVGLALLWLFVHERRGIEQARALR